MHNDFESSHMDAVVDARVSVSLLKCPLNCFEATVLQFSRSRSVALK